MDIPDTFYELEMDDGRVATYWPVLTQPYENCEFSAGLVEGIEPDTIYLRLKKDDEDPYIFFLRPDEAQAITWILNGALWSLLMTEKGVSTNGED